MEIIFSPQRCDETLRLEKAGDTLIINGERFDFSPLPEGGVLPVDAVTSHWFCGPVRRYEGRLYIIVMLPHGANPASEIAFPQPVRVIEDGPILLPEGANVEY